MRLALALVVLAVVGPFVHNWTAQPGSRYVFTAALVEQQTIRIDDYRAGTARIDRVDLGDELYSDKAPGQPFYAVPFFALARAVGAEEATTVRLQGNLGLWWITLWSSMIPMAGLVVLMHEAARRFYPATAASAALALWAGTMWLVLSANLYGHALSTLLAFAAWLVLADRTATPSRSAIAGLLVGLSVLTEYPMALIAVILGGYLVTTKATRSLPWYVLGGLPPAVLLFWYQASAFGNPLQNPYAEKTGSEPTSPITGIPNPWTFLQVVAGLRGLIFTSIVIVGAAGLIWMIKTKRPGSRHAWMGVAVFGAFLLLQSGWPNPWGGEVPGPRYLMPAVPWLAVSTAAVWSVRPSLCRAATAVGVFFMVFPLVTEHLIPHGVSFFPWYIEVLRDNGVNPTIFTIAIGPAGWLVQAAAVSAGLALVARESRLASGATSVSATT